MDKVLNITRRLEDKKRKEQIASERQKLETMQRIVQCASCHFKCAMCGYHLKASEDPSAPDGPSRGFILCETCEAEFQDFLKMAPDKGGGDLFWHNKEWQHLWSAWVDYQKAIEAFKRSPEFHWMIKGPDS